jgi:hypothetical protein
MSDFFWQLEEYGGLFSPIQLTHLLVGLVVINTESYFILTKVYQSNSEIII